MQSRRRIIMLHPRRQETQSLLHSCRYIVCRDSHRQWQGKHTSIRKVITVINFVNKDRVKINLFQNASGSLSTCSGLMFCCRYPYSWFRVCTRANLKCCGILEVSFSVPYWRWPGGMKLCLGGRVLRAIGKSATNKATHPLSMKTASREHQQWTESDLSEDCRNNVSWACCGIAWESHSWYLWQSVEPQSTDMTLD